MSKERQLGWGEGEGCFVKKQTRREAFPAEMEAVEPFSALLRLVEPFYPPLPPSGAPKGKAIVSAGGDATHSLGAELVFPQGCSHGE